MRRHTNECAVGSAQTCLPHAHKVQGPGMCRRIYSIFCARGNDSGTYSDLPWRARGQLPVSNDIELISSQCAMCIRLRFCITQRTNVIANYDYNRSGQS